MQFTVNAAAFTEAAAWANRSINNRPPVPILSGILVQAGADGVQLSGFDYGASTRARFAADVDGPFRAVLPGRVLNDILAKLNKKNPVTLTIEGSRATLTSGKSKFNLALLPEGEYPDLPEVPEHVATIDGDAFARAIKQVSVAASHDQTLAILTGVHMIADSYALTMRATDRYRLASITVPWNLHRPALDAEWLIPAAALDSAARMAAGEMDVLASDTVIGFRSGNRLLTTAQIDGDYPKIGGLFPQETAFTVRADRDELLEAIARTAVVAERNTPVRLTCTAGEIQLDAGTGEDSQAADYVNAELDGTDKLVMRFNPHYLTEAVTVMPDGMVTFGAQSHTAKPVLILPEDSEYKHLLMPVRGQ